MKYNKPPNRNQALDKKTLSLISLARLNCNVKPGRRGALDHISSTIEVDEFAFRNNLDQYVLNSPSDCAARHVHGATEDVFNFLHPILDTRPYVIISQSEIARETGHHRSTVNQAIQMLVKLGLLNMISRRFAKAPCLYSLSGALRNKSTRERLAPYFKVLLLSVSMLMSLCLSEQCEAYNKRQIEEATHNIKKDINIITLFRFETNITSSNFVSNRKVSTQARRATPEVRPNTKNSYNGKQPKRKREEMSIIKPKSNEYKTYSDKLQKQPAGPAYKPYIDKPHKIKHEDVYISYFKVQDNYRENGNPLGLPNPYREKFIEMIEEASDDSGITKTQLKQEAYKVYLAKKEANDI